MRLSSKYLSKSVRSFPSRVGELRFPVKLVIEISEHPLIDIRPFFHDLAERFRIPRDFNAADDAHIADA